MPKRTKQETVKLVLRLPPEVHARLVKAAESHVPRLSLNSEMVRRLFATLADEDLSNENVMTLEEARGNLRDTVHSLTTRDLLFLSGQIHDVISARAEEITRASKKKGKK